MSTRGNSKVKYFRNMTPNPIRIGDINFGPHGGRDVAEVPVEKINDSKFAPSIGLLIQEITAVEYKERITSAFQENSVANPEYKLPQVFTVTQTPDGKSKEIKQDVEFEGQLNTGLRVAIDSAQFQGSDFATGSRPDPAAGKTLSEME